MEKREKSVHKVLSTKKKIYSSKNTGDKLLRKRKKRFHE